MISVIILTSNKNISVLEVPENGRLIIKERHLIVGLVSNGLKMIPSARTSPLMPIETYLQNECQGVEMLHQHLFHPEGRIIDFTVIELLQSQYTIHPANSGSTSEFVSPVYSSNGAVIDYNLKMKGSEFTSVEDAQNWIRFAGTATGNSMNTIVVNGLATDADGYQLLSVSDMGTGSIWIGTKFKTGPGTNITEFYDLGGLFTELHAHTFNSDNLVYASFPGATVTQDHTFGAVSPSLKEVHLPALSQWGATTAKDGTNFVGFYQAPLNLKLTVSNAALTNNAGGVEGNIADAITNRGLQVTYV